MTARTWAATARTAGAIVGGLALSVSGALCLAVAWPGPSGLGLPLAMAVSIPAWIAAACWLFVTASARRVWATSILGSAVLVAVAAALRLARG